MSVLVLSAIAAGAAVPAFGLFLRYRRDLNAARARLATVDRHVISTPWGAVEYAELGSGDPVLVVHGIFDNCVGAVLSVRDLSGRRLIAPSRFGYLGSNMPLDATPAHQADAFVPLLDALGIDRIDVIGVSAGATSALQLALRHPERVKHLAVLVGNLPGSPTAVVQASSTKLFNRQLPLWVLRTFAPSTMVRLVAGLPKGFAMSREDTRVVTEFIDSLFPVSPEGVDFDAFVSNADVNDYTLEAVTVPTLIIHTKDDQMASHEASQRAAGRIPGARFVSLESGGHLMLGQTKRIRDELADFFAKRTDRRAEASHLEHALVVRAVAMKPIGISNTVLSRDGTRIGYLSVGGGRSVLVIPGVLSMAADYAGFARALSKHFAVHTIERRGRGESGAQGDDYSIVKECEDVLALQAATGAALLVGHSYGGLVALEVARNNKAFSKIAVYEPGVSIDGSMPTAWMPGYAKKIAEKRNIDALVEFTLADAPPRIQKTPRWLMKLLLLGLVSCSRQYRQMLDLLDQNLREWREIARLDSSCEHYREVGAGVLLMYGGRSDSNAVTLAMERLAAILPHSVTKEFPRLDHFGIERTAPREVAKAVSDFFLG